MAKIGPPGTRQDPDAFGPDGAVAPASEYTLSATEGRYRSATMSRSILLSPSVDVICGILNPGFGSVSGNFSSTVVSSIQTGEPVRGSHGSTLDRSTGNGKTRRTVVPPTPSTAIAVPYGRSIPLTTTRTALAA